MNPELPSQRRWPQLGSTVQSPYLANLVARQFAAVSVFPRAVGCIFDAGSQEHVIWSHADPNVAMVAYTKAGGDWSVGPFVNEPVDEEQRVVTQTSNDPPIATRPQAASPEPAAGALVNLRPEPALDREISRLLTALCAAEPSLAQLGARGEDAKLLSALLAAMKQRWPHDERHSTLLSLPPVNYITFVAAGRGDLSTTGLQAAYMDLAGSLPLRSGGAYCDVLNTNPLRVARWLRELAGEDVP